jgi:hypothetical protein
VASVSKTNINSTKVSQWMLLVSCSTWSLITVLTLGQTLGKAMWEHLNVFFQWQGSGDMRSLLEEVMNCDL